MKKLIGILISIFIFSQSFSQTGDLDKNITATDTLETETVFRYQETNIPVLDISYVEFSSDELNWHKAYINGDTFIRYSTDTKSNWYSFPLSGSPVDLSEYWRSDGSSLATNNWSLGDYYIMASGFIVADGTSDQFLKADGSLDNSVYLTSYLETDPIFGTHTVYNIIDGEGFLKNDGLGNWSYDNSSYLQSSDLSPFWKSDGSSTITGNWNLGSYSVSSSYIPTTDYNLTNKLYVDGLFSSINFDYLTQNYIPVKGISGLEDSKLNVVIGESGFNVFKFGEGLTNDASKLIIYGNSSGVSKNIEIYTQGISGRVFSNSQYLSLDANEFITLNKPTFIYGNLSLYGLLDNIGSLGTNGNILKSTGTQVSWGVIDTISSSINIANWLTFFDNHTNSYTAGLGLELNGNVLDLNLAELSATGTPTITEDYIPWTDISGGVYQSDKKILMTTFGDLFNSKFVTLGTTQDITGSKTFTTSSMLGNFVIDNTSGSGGRAIVFNVNSTYVGDIQTSPTGFTFNSNGYVKLLNGSVGRYISVETSGVLMNVDQASTAYTLYYNPTSKEVTYELAPSGGSGSTNLDYSGTSSPVTLRSSTGTDVTITAGSGISLSANSTNLTITSTAGGGNVSSGTYTTNQLAFWSGTNIISGDADLTFDGTNLYATAIKTGAIASTDGDLKITLNTGSSGTIDLSEALKIVSKSSAPTSSTGLIYFNTTDSKFYGYNGTMWLDLGASSVNSAPIDAAYLTLSANSTLTNERVFIEGEGINFVGTSSTLTISVEDATTTNRGIASFNTNNFSVSSGAVSIKIAGIQLDKLATYGTPTSETFLRGDGYWATAETGSGAPTDAYYLTTIANGGLTNEVVVGTTPSGDLGGTWANISVDDDSHNHTGSTISGLGVSDLGGVSGTPSASNYLRGDGSWSTVPSSEWVLYTGVLYPVSVATKVRIGSGYDATSYMLKVTGTANITSSLTVNDYVTIGGEFANISAPGNGFHLWTQSTSKAGMMTTTEGDYVLAGGNQGEISLSLNYLLGNIATRTLSSSITIAISNLPDGAEGHIEVLNNSSYTCDISSSQGLTLKKMGTKSNVLANGRTTIIYWRTGSILYYGYLYEN